MPGQAAEIPHNLPQLGILGFGLFQDGGVGVSVFPKGEEVLIGVAAFRGRASKGIGSAQADMGKRISRCHRSQCSVAENPPKLGRGLLPSLSLKVNEASNVNWKKAVIRAQFVTTGGPQGLYGFVRLAIIGLQYCQGAGDVDVIRDSVERVASVQFLNDTL